jgi:hypothetical protein
LRRVRVGVPDQPDVVAVAGAPPSGALMAPLASGEPSVQADPRAGGTVMAPLRSPVDSPRSQCSSRPSSPGGKDCPLLAPSMGRNPCVQARSGWGTGIFLFGGKHEPYWLSHMTHMGLGGRRGLAPMHRAGHGSLSTHDVAAAAGPPYPSPIRALTPGEPSVQAVLGVGGTVIALYPCPSSGCNPCVQARSGAGGGQFPLGSGISRAASLCSSQPARRGSAMEP